VSPLTGLFCMFLMHRICMHGPFARERPAHPGTNAPVTTSPEVWPHSSCFTDLFDNDSHGDFSGGPPHHRMYAQYLKGNVFEGAIFFAVLLFFVFGKRKTSFLRDSLGSLLFPSETTRNPPGQRTRICVSDSLKERRLGPVPRNRLWCLFVGGAIFVFPKIFVERFRTVFINSMKSKM